MHAAPDETRVRTLLYCMGPRALVVLGSLMSNKDTYMSYAEVTRRLTSYIVLPVNENERYVEVHVNEHPLVFKKDSNADVSVVPRVFHGFSAELDKPRCEERLGPSK
ncbi:hypothetical protein MRX96_007037 [Rhipicephalus microplus]